MAKRSDSSTDADDGDDSGIKAEVVETATVDPLTEPVPDGYDEAIYREGQRAAREYYALSTGGDPAVSPGVPVNPFEPGTNQNEAWNAGYGAALPPPE